MPQNLFIQQLQQADEKAFAVLLNEYQEKIIATCYKFLLHQQEAEDVAQEVFIEVFHSIKNYRGEAKLSTWIYRIAVSKCLDEIKKQNRKKRISSIGKLVGLEDVAHWLSGGMRPDKQFEQKENYKIIFQALNELPENQRVAYTLSKVEGYSNIEIADIMQTSIAAVESLIKRAKNKLKTDLEVKLKKSS
jgi:RNA polymerase sigma-70 factor, ECF subfamily